MLSVNQVLQPGVGQLLMGDVGQQVLHAVVADGDLLLVMAAPAITVFAFRFLKAKLWAFLADETPVLGWHPRGGRPFYPEIFQGKHLYYWGQRSTSPGLAPDGHPVWEWMGYSRKDTATRSLSELIEGIDFSAQVRESSGLELPRRKGL